jgi:RNA polymerase sigma-54 factor
MKQSMQLRLGQTLTMTPQLQQAIRLLQLSTLELQDEIQDALESNIMLETEAEAEHEKKSETPEQPVNSSNSETNSSANDPTNDSSVVEAPTNDSTVDLQQKETLPDELPVDSGWDDVYEPLYQGASSDDEFVHQDKAEESLWDHLLWQLNLSNLSEQDRAIGITVIDAINDKGYLTESAEELFDNLKDEFEIDVDDVHVVIHVIQNFDPPGICAIDLAECLLLQMRLLPEETPYLKEAKILVGDYFDLLSNRDYKKLTSKMKLDNENLQQVLNLVQTFDPAPGEKVAPATPEYIVPDVIVKKHKGRWRVNINGETAPRLRINPYYASLTKTASKDDAKSLKSHMQEARWFIKSLESRNDTLLRVSTSIVRRQQAFLDEGDEGMRAMVLRDIAEELEMHESTISRVTSKKYMHTPRGIYELKYFFSSHVNTDSGGECSATAIRALIKKMIAVENIVKPLSDDKLSLALKEKGIKVARRTVAKYRESMNIPPSNERKRLA